MKFTCALASVVALATVPTQASEFFDNSDDGLFGSFGMLKYYRPEQMPMLQTTKDPAKPSVEPPADKNFTKTKNKTIAPLKR